jgi:hypothetical protein
MDNLISALAIELGARITVAAIASIEPFETWIEQLRLLIHGTV